MWQRSRSGREVGVPISGSRSNRKAVGAGDDASCSVPLWPYLYSLYTEDSPNVPIANSEQQEQQASQASAVRESSPHDSAIPVNPRRVTSAHRRRAQLRASRSSVQPL